MGCTSSKIVHYVNIVVESDTLSDKNRKCNDIRIDSINDTESNQTSETITIMGDGACQNTTENTNITTTRTIDSIYTNTATKKTTHESTGMTESTASRYPMLYTRNSDKSIQSTDDFWSKSRTSLSSDIMKFSDRQGSVRDSKGHWEWEEMEETVRSVMLLEETNGSSLQCDLSSRSFSLPRTRNDDDDDDDEI